MYLKNLQKNQKKVNWQGSSARRGSSSAQNLLNLDKEKTHPNLSTQMAIFEL